MWIWASVILLLTGCAGPIHVTPQPEGRRVYIVQFYPLPPLKRGVVKIELKSMLYRGGSNQDAA